jgi:putative membrane protein
MDPTPGNRDGTRRFDPRNLERPDPSLLKYYGLVSLMSGPMFPFVFIPLYCKFVTLRYRIEDEGIAMSYGVLFRREVYLTYQRIQDIHLTRNFVQRWMGLATLAIQTASGSAMPEMSIEGIQEADQLRDFLYAKMRGVRGDSALGEDAASRVGVQVDAEQRALQLLAEIRDALRQCAAAKEQN